MNSKTRDALKELCEKVNFMTQGSIHMIGLETAKEVMQACSNLSKALDKDETIVGD